MSAVSAVSAVAAPLAALVTLRLLYDAALHAWPPGGLSGSSTVDEVVLGLLAWAAVALCAWLTLGVTLTALTRIPGRLGRWVAAMADVVTPAVLRSSLAMLIGVSVSTVALPAGPASASAGSPAGATVTNAGPSQRATRPPAEPSPAFVPSRSVTQQASTTGTDRSTNSVSTTSSTSTEAGGPGYRVTDRHDDRQGNGQGNRQQGPGWRPTVPVRMAGEPSTLLTPAPRTSAAPIEHVTVRRGDSLWSIVARHLGPSASDAEIAHEWPRWFDANADVIGDDPDLVLPGQQLVPPLTGARP